MLALLRETFLTTLSLLKIMVPVSIAIRLLETTGLMMYLGIFLAPVMQLTDLPGDTGIVWATTLITNIYGGMIALVSMAQSTSLNLADLTVLCTMMLIAHTFPVELQIAQQARIKLWIMFVIRFVSALLAGFLLQKIYTILNLYQQPWKPSWLPATVRLSHLEWLLNELKNYALIALIIFSLLALMRFLKYTGIIHFISKALQPLLSKIGIGPEIIPITMIGLTMGLLYGGSLIIKETSQGQLNRLQVFYAFVLMGLCHALIEDTILMATLGASLTGILFFRCLYGFAVTALIVKGLKILNTSKAEALLLNK